MGMLTRRGLPLVLGLAVLSVVACEGGSDGAGTDRLSQDGGKADAGLVDAAGAETSSRAPDARAPLDAPPGPPPFAAPTGCVTAPDAGLSDAGTPGPGADGASGSPLVDAGDCAALACRAQDVTTVVGSGVFMNVSYPACCASAAGEPVCGVHVYEQCYPRDGAGGRDRACPGGCCRADGTCGVAQWGLGLGCVASEDAAPPTCRAAAGPNPGECACTSCAEEVAACAADPACAAVVECRAGRSTEHPGAAQAYALADALDACLERGGCERLSAIGLCREACPSGGAGGVRFNVTLVGCCRNDGFCGVEYEDGCIGYDDPQLASVPRSLTGPAPTCHAAALPHPDPCACDACDATLLDCARSPSCIAISECRVATGCTGAGCADAASCGAVVEANGGVSGAPARAASDVEACLSSASCRTNQFGLCH